MLIHNQSKNCISANESSPSNSLADCYDAILIQMYCIQMYSVVFSPDFSVTRPYSAEFSGVFLKLTSEASYSVFSSPQLMFNTLT